MHIYIWKHICVHLFSNLFLLQNHLNLPVFHKNLFPRLLNCDIFWRAPSMWKYSASEAVSTDIIKGWSTAKLKSEE